MASQTDESGSEKRIQAVETLFDVVEGLQELGQAGVSELADHLGRPKSTVHIYLATLVDVGYVIKEGDQYRTSLRFLNLGGQTRKRMSIYQAARPEIDSLSKETGEVANFGIEEQGQRVLLYSSEPHDGVSDNAPAGEYTNMHWTAIGKALLSQLPEDRVNEIIDEHGLPRATPKTITDREELFEELDLIRERGYSIEDEERRERIKSVAVPIQYTDESAPVSAVAISGPMRRIGEDEINEEFVDALMDTVNVIELKYKHY